MSATLTLGILVLPQIIGLIPSSRTLSCKIAPGSADDFTDSMAETYALPRDSIKVDPRDLGTSFLGVFAEFETNLRRERQAEGIVAARQRGAYRGRPPI